MRRDLPRCGPPRPGLTAFPSLLSFLYHRLCFTFLCLAGTNERALIQVLCNRTFEQRRRIEQTFQINYRRELLKYLKSETSGRFEKVLVHLMRSPAMNAAAGAREAIKVKHSAGTAPATRRQTPPAANLTVFVFRLSSFSPLLEPDRAWAPTIRV